ncbi:MAG: hypothetical protein NTZ01_05600, partial [Verrucomicrobia bacterium]|nr:hypothetical protein [Verrucomicrobiota bacterium]
PKSKIKHLKSFHLPSDFNLILNFNWLLAVLRVPESLPLFLELLRPTLRSIEKIIWQNNLIPEES